MTRLQQLIGDITARVIPGRPPRLTADGVSQVLQQAILAPELLSAPHREPSPASYRQHVLHVAPDRSFSVVSLVWLPGQQTPIHNHRGWCVVGVHEGEEFETQYRIVDVGLEERRLREAGSVVNRRGFTTGLVPPHDVHRVANRSSGTAISIHVYGVDMTEVGSSIDRRFDAAVVDNG
jgi:3-mercaptopropionate dioxygenase